MTASLSPVTTQAAASAQGGKPPASPQQLAALKQLVAKYATDQSHKAPADTLANLGRQILTMSAQLGQHIRLPAGSSSAASAPPTAGAAKGAFDVTA